MGFHHLFTEQPNRLSTAFQLISKGYIWVVSSSFLILGKSDPSISLQFWSPPLNAFVFVVFGFSLCSFCTWFVPNLRCVKRIRKGSERGNFLHSELLHNIVFIHRINILIPIQRISFFRHHGNCIGTHSTLCQPLSLLFPELLQSHHLVPEKLSQRLRIFLMKGLVHGFEELTDHYPQQ